MVLGFKSVRSNVPIAIPIGLKIGPEWIEINVICFSKIVILSLLKAVKLYVENYRGWSWKIGLPGLELILRDWSRKEIEQEIIFWSICLRVKQNKNPFPFNGDIARKNMCI